MQISLLFFINDLLTNENVVVFRKIKIVYYKVNFNSYFKIVKVFILLDFIEFNRL